MQIDTCKRCTMGQGEKDMKFSLEIELDVHEDEEPLVTKDEPQDVEQPQDEDRGVVETTYAETSRRGKFRARWVEGVHVAIPPGVRWGDVQN